MIILLSTNYRLCHKRINKYIAIVTAALAIADNIQLTIHPTISFFILLMFLSGPAD